MGYATCFRMTQVEKGMYGVPHTGIVTQDILTKRFNDGGYRQHDKTPGFWKHDTGPIYYALIVDYFGVKYVGKEHAQHLVDVPEELYVVANDWTKKKYCGINLD